MITTFTIKADTSAMRVELRVSQGGRVKFRREFETVTQAAEWLLNSIAIAMDKHNERNSEHASEQGIPGA